MVVSTPEVWSRLAVTVELPPFSLMEVEERISVTVGMPPPPGKASMRQLFVPEILDALKSLEVILCPAVRNP